MNKVRLGDIQRKTITKSIGQFSDKELKILLLKWVEMDELVEIVGINYISGKKPYPQAHKICKFLSILNIYVSNEMDLIWSVYCKIQHEFTRNISTNQRKEYRSLLRSLFLYSSEQASNGTLRFYLKQNIHLFMDTEIIISKSKRRFNQFILQNVRTNFPLLSNEEQIIQVENFFEGTKYGDLVNFFVPSNNTFLLNIIKLFNQQLSKHDSRHFNTLDHRVFITYLPQSISTVAYHLEDFDQLMFKEQTLFYQNLITNNGWDGEKEDVRIIGMLIKFYLFLDDEYFLQHGNRLFNTVSFNRDIMRMPNYTKYIKENYEFVMINSIEDVPKSDKWVLLPRYSENTSNVGLNRTRCLDFTKIQNEDLKTELKNYVWNSTSSNQDIATRFFRLVDFVNDAHCFFESEKKISYIGKHSKPKLFSNTFLILYYSKVVSNEIHTPGTINQTIAYMRSFLEFIRYKYEISKMIIKQLSYLALEDIGGKPISKEDFEEIKDAFKEQSSSPEGELMFILFQLTLSTKLRIGEALTLQRNCVVSINEESGYGTIQYFSKTSYGDITKELFLLKYVRIIERAIQLTEPVFELANDDMKDYIFIGLDTTRRGRVMSLHNSYKDTFRKIVLKLFESGKIQEKYSPYNARHTYIENAWQGVEDGHISTLEVSTITGNSATTAVKHYRKRENIQRYVEAIYEVAIKDSDLCGQVTDDEESLKHLPPVQQGAGACLSEECIKLKVKIEDTEYICLACNKFVTTIERIPLFEKRLEQYKQEQTTAQSITIKKYFTGLIEIYGAYLTRMYSLMEVDNE